MSRNVAERVSIIMLLSNYACSVAQRGARQLHFRCTGSVVTWFLLVGAAVAALAVVAFAILMNAGGNVAKGILGALMGVLLAVWSTRLAVNRYRCHGRFELDADEGVLRRYRVGRLVDEFVLDDITRVWLVLDLSDGIRLNTTPSWLQIGMRNGAIFRLAKGTRKELEPVCEAMRRLGLSPT